MAVTLDAVATGKKGKPERTAEQELAEEMVARPGAGRVADRPGGAAQAAHEGGPGDRAEPGDDRLDRELLPRHHLARDRGTKPPVQLGPARFRDRIRPLALGVRYRGGQ